MGKESYGESETGNWNSAKRYSDSKIVRWLIAIDTYEIIATFGTEEINNQLAIDEATKTLARIVALRRMCKTLLLLVRNTQFAVKEKDKKTMTKFKEQLQKVRELIDTTFSETANQIEKTKKLVINEKKFLDVLDLMSQIAEEINEPLNRADLIFTSIETHDPKEIMAKIKEELTSLG